LLQAVAAVVVHLGLAADAAAVVQVDLSPAQI
jgi:hypothetical protein